MEDLLPREPVERDVVRVHERCHREPRSFAARGRELVEQLGDLVGEDPVAHGAGVGFLGTVRLAPDPPGEAEGVEAVGAAVRVDHLGEQATVVVGGHQRMVGAGHEQVGVRHVPLAAVVRAVPRGAEPVADGRHLVGVEPVHRRIVVVFGDAVGLRRAVQRRVLPGEHGGPAREAGGRTDIVPVELEPAIAHRTRGQVSAPGGTSGRRRPRRAWGTAPGR